MASTPRTDAADPGTPPYPAGLRLGGRRVVVVGGGAVAQRRVPALLAADAVVTLISPEVTPSIEGLAAGGEVELLRRHYADGDLDGAWYVLALTDDPSTPTTTGPERRSGGSGMPAGLDSREATGGGPV